MGVTFRRNYPQFKVRKLVLEDLATTDLVSSVGWRLGCHGSFVSHQGLIDDELALAFAQILDLDSVIRNDEVAVDVELNRGSRIFHLAKGKKTRLHVEKCFESTLHLGWTFALPNDLFLETKPV